MVLRMKPENPGHVLFSRSSCFIQKKKAIVRDGRDTVKNETKVEGTMYSKKIKLHGNDSPSFSPNFYLLYSATHVLLTLRLSSLLYCPITDEGSFLSERKKEKNLARFSWPTSALGSEQWPTMGLDEVKTNYYLEISYLIRASVQNTGNKNNKLTVIFLLVRDSSKKTIFFYGSWSPCFQWFLTFGWTGFT